MFEREHETRFGELFGKRLTREELIAQNEEARARGCWFTEIRKDATDDEIQPWHVGWKYSRDGGTDITGEWQPGSSWSAHRIIRPSYRQDTCVKLILHVHGKAEKKYIFRVKPERWHAELKMGWRNWWIPDQDSKRWQGSCKSIADAMRKADAIPDLDEQVRAFLKHTYSPAGAKAVFRQNQAGEYEPCFTWLNIVDDPMQWENGQYMKTYWEAPSHGKDIGKVLLHSYEIDRSWLGYSGSSIPAEGSTPWHRSERPMTPEEKAEREERYALVRKLGCWLPRPEPAKETEAA